MRENNKTMEGFVGNCNIQKLSKQNYDSWKVEMKNVLILNDLWPYVNGEIIKTDQNAVEFDKKDEKALAFILLSVRRPQFNHIMEAKTAYDAWTILKKKYEAKDSMKETVLYEQLRRMKKRANERIMEFVDKFQYKAKELEEFGIKIPKEMLSLMLLNTLPKEYETFCTEIKLCNNIPSIESLKMQLIEHEEQQNDCMDREYSKS